ncbi:MAG: hypothetical protein HFH10_15820 [Dorea sp.]|nr:hypothetical protein [Dorea sp.]
MKFDEICEDGKVAVALSISEIMLRIIDERNRDWDYFRKSVDLCWDWLMYKEIPSVRICERIGNIDNCAMPEIILRIKDINLANRYGSILECVSYAACHAFDYETPMSPYPSDIEGIDDEYLEELILELIEKKEISFENYETILNYVRNNYHENNKIVMKQEIISIVDAITPDNR